MKGTDKQIAWAENIRTKAMDKVFRAYERQVIAEYIDMFKEDIKNWANSYQSASEWINMETDRSEADETIKWCNHYAEWANNQ